VYDEPEWTIFSVFDISGVCDGVVGELALG